MSFSGSQKRQSFDERIWDDLSEDILQYLSLEDKLRLECVSKQFQRTVFQRQYELKFNKRVINALMATILGYKSSAMESIAKKCTKINSIVINPWLEGCWRVLRSLNLSKEVNIIYKDINGVPLRFRISDFNFNKLKNIKKVKIRAFLSEFSHLETLVKNNPKLQRLDIRCHGFESADKIHKFMDQILKLKHLIELKVWTEYKFVDNTFTQKLGEMAINCPNLRSIGFNTDIQSNMRRFLSPLKSFKQLNRLDINIGFEYLFSWDNQTLFECFEGFQELTHLKLNYVCDRRLKSKEFLNNIDVSLPKLRYLDINKKIYATERIVDILGRLLSLESIKLNFKYKSDTFDQRLRANLYENCKRIRNIKLKP